MSRDDGKVVTDKQWAWYQSLVQEGLDVTLDGPRGWVQMNSQM